MDATLVALAAFLLANLLVALRRVMKGPTPADRMLTALLFGSTGVAVLLLLGEARALPALVDVALVFALLAAVSGAAFTERAWREEVRQASDNSGEEGQDERHRSP